MTSLPISSDQDLPTASDVLQTFLFEASQVRGEIVRLENSWQVIQSRREYPLVIKRHLGEMVAAGVLLSATLKFDGTLIIQAQGSGLVQLLVVECTATMGIRATIKLSPGFDAAELSDKTTLADLINPDGQGKLVITLDPTARGEGQQAYQGIVPLVIDGRPVETIAEAIMVYMKHSEQLETRLWLASNEHFASGVLLQKIPSLGEKKSKDHLHPEELDDAWVRLQFLTDTVKNDELLNTPPARLMTRLFETETEFQKVLTFPERIIKFSCQCSRHRVGDMLLMLGADEVESILNELGHVETICEFCGLGYLFDTVDCKQLFATKNAIEAKPQIGKH